MTPQEMWNAYKQITPSIGDEMDAWAFGVEPDLLADLVFTGEKTATASAYDLYAVEDEHPGSLDAYKSGVTRKTVSVDM